MFGVFARLSNLERDVRVLKQERMELMALIDDLKAAVQADFDMDAKLTAALADVSAKLTAALAAPSIDAAAIQAVIDEINKHVAADAAALPPGA